jgi:ribonuclease HII
VLDVPVRGLDDSKVLPAEVRDELASRIEKTSRAAVGAATAAEIDALGIGEATLLAMRRALACWKRSAHASISYSSMR